MMAGIVAGGRPFQAVNGGPLAWYKMDSIAGGILVDELGANSGTVANASLVAGRFGNAIQCNGANTLGSVPHSTALDCAAFSTSVWVNFTSSLNLIIVEKNGFVGWSLQCIDTGIANSFGGSSGQLAVVSGGATNILRSGVSVNSGTWRHVVATVDYAAGVNKMYVDGVLTSPASGPGSSVSGLPAYVVGPLSIGQRPVNIGQFSGAIDDLRLYSRVLSAAEVLQLYSE